VTPTAQIKVYGRIYPAAVCQKCGMRVYPPQGVLKQEAQHRPNAKRYRRNFVGGKHEAGKWEATW
jgi:hypothetical protein